MTKPTKNRVAGLKHPATGSATDVTEFDRDGPVYEKNGVKVIAFEVDHGDVIKPCYGYRIEYGGRVAVLTITKALADAAGGSYDDTEGIINFPLTVKDIQAVAFFKEMPDGTWRVSMRSKGDVDVRAIAGQFGGGGHVNASGCSATGELAALQKTFMQLLVHAVA